MWIAHSFREMAIDLVPNALPALRGLPENPTGTQVAATWGKIQAATGVTYASVEKAIRDGVPYLDDVLSPPNRVKR